MGILPLDQITPGMVLAQDVRLANGRLLLNRQISLSERHLHILKSWGVLEADIEGIEAGPEHPAIDAAILLRVKPEADRIFQHANLDHPAMRKLYDLRLQRLGAALEHP